MKTILQIILIISFSSYAQTDNNETVIKDIREKYSIITQSLNNNKYSEHKTSYYCMDAEDAAVSIYFDDNGIKLIKNILYRGGHSWKNEYYYVWENKLFFVYTQGGSWTYVGPNDNSNTAVTVSKITEKRVYFNDEKAIRCLTKDYKSISNAEVKSENIPNKKTNCDKAQELINRYKKLFTLKMLNKKEFGCIWEN
ncbi:hypothetical protein OAX11_02185 [Flavobacteriaceae bacterium]|nr:hypothetical protein [Flavobacteriaceae bacterium]